MVLVVNVVGLVVSVRLLVVLFMSVWLVLIWLLFEILSMLVLFRVRLLLVCRLRLLLEMVVVGVDCVSSGFSVVLI